eukprot:2836986-Alexandrium_andersonii.AAC.1
MQRNSSRISSSEGGPTQTSESLRPMEMKVRGRFSGQPMSWGGALWQKASGRVALSGPWPRDEILDGV